MRPARRVAPLAALLLLTVACHTNDVTATAVGASRGVSFPSSDGVQLSGRLFGPDSATTGVVLAHMLPADQSSWYEFAIEIFDRAGLLVRVLPVTTERFPRPARRPAYSVLGTERDPGVYLPAWQEGLAAYLAQREPLVDSALPGGAP